MVCHQRQIRDHEAGRHPRTPDTSLNYRVVPIGADESKAFIQRYEWLGTSGRAIAKYGARNADGELVAVALFGRTAGTNAGDVCGSEYRDKAICLERGACAHWAHPHTASWFIPRAVARAAREHGWRIFYAYSDEDAGEIGTVYQACNWHYIGQGAGRPEGRPRESFRSPEMIRNGTHPNGVEERTLRHMGLKKSEIMKAGWQCLKTPAKHKYVWFEGTKREQCELRRALRYEVLKYPKRATP